MSFEAFEVYLYPVDNIPIFISGEFFTLDEVVEKIQVHWAEFQRDDFELTQRYEPLEDDTALLVYKTDEGLIQLYIRIHAGRIEYFALRFAFCNPRTINELFCQIVENLMRIYRLYCHIASDLAPSQKNIPRDIVSSESVCHILIPSIEYNRWLWQLDADTEEEAILRPGDAIAMFMPQRYINSTVS